MCACFLSSARPASIRPQCSCSHIRPKSSFTSWLYRCTANHFFAGLCLCSGHDDHHHPWKRIQFQSQIQAKIRLGSSQGGRKCQITNAGGFAFDECRFYYWVYLALQQRNVHTNIHNRVVDTEYRWRMWLLWIKNIPHTSENLQAPLHWGLQLDLSLKLTILLCTCMIYKLHKVYACVD